MHRRENRALPVRLPGRSSLYFLRRAERWWHITLITLPLDALLVFYLPLGAVPGPLDQVLTKVTVMCAAAAALGLFRASLFRQLENTWRLSGQLDVFRARYGSILIGLFAAFSFLDVLLRLGHIGWLVIGAILLVGARAFTAVRGSIEANREERARFENDKVLLLESRNAQVFYLIALPIVALRLSALGGTVLASQSGLPEEALLNYLAIGATALVGLLALYPYPDHFIGRCPRCARSGSRVLESLRGCPTCAREEFQVTEPQPMSADLTRERNLVDMEPEDSPTEPPPSPRSWRAVLVRILKKLPLPGAKDA
jgi:hypothetical protein